MDFHHLHVVQGEGVVEAILITGWYVVLIRVEDHLKTLGVDLFFLLRTIGVLATFLMVNSMWLL
jgi:hypothetical protein